LVPRASLLRVEDRNKACRNRRCPCEMVRDQGRVREPGGQARQIFRGETVLLGWTVPSSLLGGIALSTTSMAGRRRPGIGQTTAIQSRCFVRITTGSSSAPAATELGNVRLSFFGGLGMGRVGVPDFTEDGVALVASSLDLLGTKFKVIMQRAESKDYSDIAQLLRAGPSLIQELGAARSLYGSAFAPAECLRALTFFDDGDLSRVDAKNAQHSAN